MFFVRTSLPFLLLFTCFAGPGYSQNKPENETIDIVGLYQCEGHKYKGTVSITQLGETYQLRWNLGNQIHTGVALREGDLLSSSWSVGRNVSGIVVYKIEPGPRLVGKYTYPQSGGKVRSESLIFLKELPKLPEPREWEVNEAPLVNWSRDGYWYPARVTRKEEGRYYVQFDDGDKEWTTAPYMIVEDIAVGDRVYGNWKNKGRYYPGIIASRDGNSIHIKYDDGDQETTTISFVRVIRPRVP